MHQDNANSEVTMALHFARHLFRPPTRKRRGTKILINTLLVQIMDSDIGGATMSSALNENENSNREVFEFVVVVHDYSSTDHRRAITTCLIKLELLHAQLYQLDAL
jgi:hypothetical protein